MSRFFLAPLLLVPLAAAACASRGPAPNAAAAGAAAPAAPALPATRVALGRPLAGLAGERVVIVPAQRLRLDSAAAPLPAGAGAAYLRSLDSLIAATVGMRGVQWAFAEDVARAARRNPTYAPDAYKLAVGELLPGRRPAQDDALADPLASQLRTLVALNDARYVVVPAELRFEPGAAGTARAVLHLALVDARASQLRWAGAVAGGPPPPPALSSTAAATLAGRLADLIAAP